jgi:hypothetical protein
LSAIRINWNQDDFPLLENHNNNNELIKRGELKMKHVYLVALTLVAASAQAKSFYDETKNRAMVLQMRDDRVQATVCENVSESDVGIASVSDTLKSEKCKVLSDQGLTQEDVERNLPEFKKKVLTYLGLFETGSKALGDMVGDEKAGDLMSEMMSGPVKMLKAQIEALTSEQIYNSEYVLEARDPSVERVEESSDLDGKIELYLILTNRPAAK